MRQPSCIGGNSLAAPYFKNPYDKLKTFDFAVANPPFSAKAWSSGLNPEHDEYGRFAYGNSPGKEWRLRLSPAPHYVA